MRTKTTLVIGFLISVLMLSSAPVEAGRTYFSVNISPYWWSWGPYWGGYHYRPYYGPYYGPYSGTALANRSVGAVDLNVKPKKADLYVDGDLAGHAGRFDGFPGYLWLDEGEHQLVLVHEGFATVAKRIEVRAGTLTDVRLEMAPGESRPASEFFVRRDSTPRSGAGSVEPYSSRERRQAMESGRERERRRAANEAPETMDARVESARLKVEITPGEASVYLDGRFLGTVSELERLHAGILIDPGEHTLSALHPDYVESALDFEAAAGEELVLKIDLRRE